MRGQSPGGFPQPYVRQNQVRTEHVRSTNPVHTVDVCDRTVVRVRRSGLQQERIRVVCTTRRQHVSRLVTVADTCHTLPPFRKHITVIR
jgi:hypothetical protein